MSAIAGLRATLLPPDKIAAKLEGLRKAAWIPGTSADEGFRYYVNGERAVAMDVRQFVGNSHCLTIHAKLCPKGEMFDFDGNGNLEHTGVNEHKAGTALDGVLKATIETLSPMQQVTKDRFDAAVRALTEK